MLFTGVKTGSWPPNTGATASGIAVPNPALAHQVERFCKAVGFHGVADLDVRFDRRDRQYKLVDFNPRMGNQFRLFETPAGHRRRPRPVPRPDRRAGAARRPDRRPPDRGRAHPPAIPAGRARQRLPTPNAPRHATETELAWLAPDDPLPFLAMLPRFAAPAMSYLSGRWLVRRRKHT